MDRSLYSFIDISTYPSIFLRTYLSGTLAVAALVTGTHILVKLVHKSTNTYMYLSIYRSLHLLIDISMSRLGTIWRFGDTRRGSTCHR